MKKEQFEKLMEGIKNPSRIKVIVNQDHDFLMSAENTNDTMDWFKVNAVKLESNLRGLNLKWVYVIETTPKNRPFIYMIISPNITTFTAEKLIDRAQRTLPGDRGMIVGEGIFNALNIDQYDHTPTTLLEIFLNEKATDVLEVLEP